MSTQVDGLCVAVVLVTLVAAGCRTDNDSAPAPQPVAKKEWRTAIADWYADGDFDQTHHCLVVREARRQLPNRSPDLQTLHEDFRALEARACRTP